MIKQTVEAILRTPLEHLTPGRRGRRRVDRALRGTRACAARRAGGGECATDARCSTGDAVPSWPPAGAASCEGEGLGWSTVVVAGSRSGRRGRRELIAGAALAAERSMDEQVEDRADPASGVGGCRIDQAGTGSWCTHAVARGDRPSVPTRRSPRGRGRRGAGVRARLRGSRRAWQITSTRRSQAYRQFRTQRRDLVRLLRHADRADLPRHPVRGHLDRLVRRAPDHRADPGGRRRGARDLGRQPGRPRRTRVGRRDGHAGRRVQRDGRGAAGEPRGDHDARRRICAARTGRWTSVGATSRPWWPTCPRR